MLNPDADPDRMLPGVEQLVALCAEWQQRLGLAHWKVAVRYARMADMNEHRDGEIEFVRPRLEALIQILYPLDFPPGPHVQDVEATLVHELLHLLWAPVQPQYEESEEYIAFEQAINLTARSLVTLRRQIPQSEEREKIDAHS